MLIPVQALLYACLFISVTIATVQEGPLPTVQIDVEGQTVYALPSEYTATIVRTVVILLSAATNQLSSTIM